MPRHPHEDARRGAHRVGAVEADARSDAAHRQALVAGRDGERLVPPGQREAEWLEIRSGVSVSRPCGGEVVGNHRLALARELFREHDLEGLDLHAGEAQHRSDGCRVVVQDALRQFRQRERAKLHPGSRVARRDAPLVVQHRRAALHARQVPVHRILIERNQHVEAVAHAAHRRPAGTDRQEGVPSADDRLVRVVGIHVQPAPREELGEDVSRGGDALARGAADTDGEVDVCHTLVRVWDRRTRIRRNRTGRHEQLICSRH